MKTENEKQTINIYGDVNGVVVGNNQGTIKGQMAETEVFSEEIERIILDYNEKLKTSQNKVRVYSWDEIDFDSIYVLPKLKINYENISLDEFIDISHFTGQDVAKYVNRFDKRGFHINDMFSIKDCSERKADIIRHMFDDDGIVYVIGGAGYGKSLFLKNLCVKPETILGYSENPFLIIRGDLKRLVENDGSLKSMESFLEESLISSSLVEPKSKHPNLINECLKAGRCLILLDALDEVGSDIRNELHDLIVSFFKSEYPNNRVCITSRERGFIPKKDITCYSISSIESDDVEDYVDNFIKLGKFDEEEKDKFVRQAEYLVEKRFIKGFLTLSLLMAIYKNEEDLPSNKISLYEKCFEYIATTREKNKKLYIESSSGQLYDWKDLTKIMTDATFMELAKLGEPNNSDISKDEINELLLNIHERRFDSDTQCKMAIDMFLHFCADRTEVFVPSPSSNEDFRFFHRSFYDFFYAKYIENRTNTPKDTFEELCNFDIDSEVFELLITLYDRKNPQYMYDFINYIKEYFLSVIDDDPFDAQKVFEIYVLLMKHVDDNALINDFIKVVVEQFEYISEMDLNIANSFISIVLNKKIDYFIDLYNQNLEYHRNNNVKHIVTMLSKGNAIESLKKCMKKEKKYSFEYPNLFCDDFSMLSLIKFMGHDFINEELNYCFKQLADRQYVLRIARLTNSKANQIIDFANKFISLPSRKQKELYANMKFYL